MKKYTSKEYVLIVFQAFMAVLYLFLGGFMILSSKAEIMIENNIIRYSLGAILLIYGIFRIIRSAKTIF